jgi:16S rRNA (adenine1518-N6/adenine1519-N6)-dimethyltransferase
MTSNPLHLSKPSHLIQYLENLGISPKKSLSQNFLIDGNIIRKIIELADIQPGDQVLEIGPGPGALTDALLANGAHVLAIEKDRTLAHALTKRSGPLTVICEDVMKVNLEKVLPSKATVIANLPYNITTPILTSLLPQTSLFSKIVVMVQHEVAERLVAHPGNKIYGSITVFANIFSKPSFGFKVSNQCFFPKPKVGSAVIRFDLISPPKEVDEPAFFTMTRTAFGQRRKMIKSSLNALYSSSTVQQALHQIGISETARPEELSADQFVQLYRQLQAPSS